MRHVANDGPRVVTTDLGGSALSRALRAGETPEAWSARVPSDVDAWRAHARATSDRCRGWLTGLRPAFGTGARLLDRIADAGVVITTGQQPGLFGGPLYTVFKALSALEMARAHEASTGIPTVPVFWAATDDADFVEAASTILPGVRGAEVAALTARPGHEGLPLAFVPLTNEVRALHARLAATCGSAADARPLEAAAEFNGDATIGGAYVAMLRALLEPMGIAVLDAAHEAVGLVSRDVLTQALARGDAIHDALEQRARALTQAGFEAPVTADRGLSLVFSWEGDPASPAKRRVSLEEARRGAPSTRLSPNVLLRPVTEGQILPTVAYVAGPGELAYFAQASAVADALNVARPLALPRWSGMVIPDEVAALLQQHDWTPEALRDPHAAETQLARAAMPPSAADGLRALRVTIDREIGRLEGVLTAAAIAGAKGDLARRLDRVERRALAVVKRREQDLLQHVARARGVLYPTGAAQERALNLVPLWARSGDAFVQRVRVEVRRHAARWWPASG